MRVARDAPDTICATDHLCFGLLDMYVYGMYCDLPPVHSEVWVRPCVFEESDHHHRFL